MQLMKMLGIVVIAVPRETCGGKSSENIQAGLPHPIHACVFRAALHFGTVNLAYNNQSQFFQIAMQYSECTCKMDVATWLKAGLPHLIYTYCTEGCSSHLTLVTKVKTVENAIQCKNEQDVDTLIWFLGHHFLNRSQAVCFGCPQEWKIKILGIAFILNLDIAWPYLTR